LARKDKWRIPERTLFLLVLFGGTIGGLGAMHVFRHKTSKRSFLLSVFGILIFQILLVLFLLFKSEYF
jgi:uncharacterized membrane protein YsdA (DUF1294 family)